jgi:hypothetical protein
MLLSFVYVLLFIHNIESFLNILTRSESTLTKERCGQSVLLNNNYWLLKQTHQALIAIRNNQITFESLPWNRLSVSVQQMYDACLIDDLKQSKERMYIRQTALKAGTLIAKKANDIKHPSLIKISRKR